MGKIRMGKIKINVVIATPSMAFIGN